MKRINCTHCHKNFQNDNTLEQHLENYHDVIRYVDIFRCYICKVCFNTSDEVEEHILEHNDRYNDNTYCKDCKLQYDEIFDYNKHMKTVHQQNFTCFVLNVILKNIPNIIIC